MYLASTITLLIQVAVEWHIKLTVVWQGMGALRPLATNTWEHAGKLHVTARSKSVEWWKALQAKLQTLLKGAKPMAQKALVTVQVRITTILQLKTSKICS